MRLRRITVLLVLIGLAACTAPVVAPLAVADDDEPRLGEVTASALNVRKGPGTEHEVVFKLTAGARVRVVGSQGDWLAVVDEGGSRREGWVHGRYVKMVSGATEGEGGDGAEATPPPLKAMPRTRKQKLAFVHEHARSTLDLLGERGRAWRAFPWERNDYPGSPAGSNEKQARALAAALSELVPERRVNTGPFKLPFDWAAIEPALVKVPGQERYRLHRLAAESFVKMREAAAKDGVKLVIVSAARTPAHQKRLSENNKNPSAVARGTSTHNYGLAIDLAMSPGAARELAEVTTRPFSNVMEMRATPAHKWMFFFGAEHGWYPYTNEPWHWEFNPEGLAGRFP